MDINQQVHLIPFTQEWYTKQIPGYMWAYTPEFIYVISEDELDFPTKTLGEITKELRYNPFEQSVPTPESELLLLDIAANLDYLVCLKDLEL